MTTATLRHAFLYAGGEEAGSAAGGRNHVGHNSRLIQPVKWLADPERRGTPLMVDMPLSSTIPCRITSEPDESDQLWRYDRRSFSIFTCLAAHFVLCVFDVSWLTCATRPHPRNQLGNAARILQPGNAARILRLGNAAGILRLGNATMIHRTKCQHTQITRYGGAETCPASRRSE